MWNYSRFAAMFELRILNSSLIIGKADHSTLNIQHLKFHIQHSTFNIHRSTFFPFSEGKLLITNLHDGFIGFVGDTQVEVFVM